VSEICPYCQTRAENIGTSMAAHYLVCPALDWADDTLDSSAVNEMDSYDALPKPLRDVCKEYAVQVTQVWELWHAMREKYDAHSVGEIIKEQCRKVMAKVGH